MTALPGEQEHTHNRGNEAAVWSPGTDSPAAGEAVRTMLEARSVALVGASARPGTFGWRMLAEAGKSSARPRIYPVNPKYAELDGRRCYPSLAELPEAPDLTLLAVPDTALEEQLALAAAVGCGSAVIFGNAHEDRPAGDTGSGLRARLAAIARRSGMALCGAGCMGFVNASHGLRALGYTELDPLPAGPVALVTHSGSAFSTLLRTRRGFGFTLAVSSGQELVTAAPAYLDYALSLPGTGVFALVMEAIRDGAGLRQVLATAADRDIPVVLLTAGGSASGRAMVAAHSGALAGSDGSWEALARAYGVHRVADLAEFADTTELFAIGRRARATTPGGTRGVFPRGWGDSGGVPPRAGIATVHDSGLERAHVADVAESVGVPFAEIGPDTTEQLASLLDPGLIPANPLDVWGTGADTRELFAGSMLALAADRAVEAVALAVDLVRELDGDPSYPMALLDVAERTNKPLAVLSNLGSAIDVDLASRLRAQGIPVLEGTRSGLAAMKHLLDHARRGGRMGADLLGPGAHQLGIHDTRIDRDRQARGAALLDGGELGRGELSGARLLALLAEYGIQVARVLPAADLGGALAAADQIGYPVVLKTDQPQIAHKSDVGGVLLGIGDVAALAKAYRDLNNRLGSRVLVCQTVPAGTELALGIVTDPGLGPLVVVGAGGVLVELLADRVVALPPVSAAAAAELVAELNVSKLLAGVRGGMPADLSAVARAIVGLSNFALELGDQLEALDINPLICGPDGAIAVDALAIPRAVNSHPPES
jgi:acyl-CoA synthetase (NDP forming)